MSVATTDPPCSGFGLLTVSEHKFSHDHAYILICNTYVAYRYGLFQKEMWRYGLQPTQEVPVCRTVIYRPISSPDLSSRLSSSDNCLLASLFSVARYVVLWFL